MKKIMFNDRYGLETAVLNGTKTMTRRIVPFKLNEILNNITKEGTFIIPTDVIPDGLNIDEVCDAFAKGDNKMVSWVKSVGEEIKVSIEDYMPLILQRAKYQVGDVVAIAQSYHTLNKSGFVAPEGLDHTCEDSAGYDNKMFVRADLMPHQIQIADVKIERLQDITDEDCLREGVERWMNCYIVPGIMENHGRNNRCFDTPRDAFHELICKISGKNIWIDNPYVFVYTFKLIK